MTGFDTASWRAEQIALLTRVQRQHFDRLVQQLKAADAPDPESWALSEVRENFPQLATFLLLRRLWRDCIEPHARVEDYAEQTIRSAEQRPTAPLADLGLSLKRLLAAGADPKDLGRFARVVAYEAVFGVVHALDEGHDPEAAGDLPQWVLMERTPQGKLTGRDMYGLHESILGLDPSGREMRPEGSGG